MGKLLFLGVAALAAVRYISYRSNQQKKLMEQQDGKQALPSGAAKEAVIDVRPEEPVSP